MNGTQCFPVIDFKQTSFQSFIDYWSNYYDYKQKMQSEIFEKDHYTIPISTDTLTEANLLKLYRWKNGSALSGKKDKSFNNKIVSRLGELNKLKNRGIKSVEEVRQICPDLSTIWLIFLTHIIDKESFPIFDMHVFRAFYYLTTNTILEIPDDDVKKLAQYENYLSYYNALKPQINDYKKWDEAMWAFGKFLSRYKPFV